MTAPVLFEVANGWGVATLNRGDALNALTLEMIRLLSPQLAAWAADPAIKAVMIEGAGDRAFCAGGDVVAIYHAIQEERRSGVASPLTRDFFFEEYQLNAAIAGFPKPYVALLHGITMGGGVGLSAGASHRIVGPGYLFAMPETGIGLFPDVGGGWYLPRLAAGFGDYLALTARASWRRRCHSVGPGKRFRRGGGLGGDARGVAGLCLGRRARCGHRSGAGAVSRRTAGRSLGGRSCGGRRAFRRNRFQCAVGAHSGRRGPFNRGSPPNPRRQITEQPAGQS